MGAGFITLTMNDINGNNTLSGNKNITVNTSVQTNVQFVEADSGNLLSTVSAGDYFIFNGVEYTYEYYGAGSKSAGQPLGGFISVTGVVNGETIDDLGDPVFEVGRDFAIHVEKADPTYPVLPNGNYGRANGLDSTTPINFPICFTPGDLVLTPYGDVPVEDLSVGDFVMTLDHGPELIRWIGRQKFSGADLNLRPHLRPVKIAAGAFGANTPTRDVVLSQQHRVLLRGERATLLFGHNEVLVPIKALLNDHSITLCPAEDGVEYIHFLFDQHELVFNQGIVSESLHPTQMSLSAYDEASLAELFEVFPDLRKNQDIFGKTARPCLSAHDGAFLGQEMGLAN